MESRCWTEKFGVNQCMIRAKNAILDNFGVKIEDATIEQVLRYKTADIGKSYLDCILSVFRRYEYNRDFMRLYIVGGGGCSVKHFGQYETNRVTILEDICATAKGYKYLAFASLRRKE